ncbi:MAG: ABC transporter permease [Actinomycetota bacterium]|nr:ABC transporter permease [Actinomycetota bacterium]
MDLLEAEPAATGPENETPSQGRTVWNATWPKLGAVGVVLLVWQIVVWTGWKPSYLFPGPREVLPRLWHDVMNGELLKASLITMRRGVVGYALAIIIGIGLGAAVSQSRILRSAIGSLITGLQTMPSIAWFPLAVLLFQASETAILFVVVLGAAPAVANGLITGVDHIPPILLRAGKMMGARGFAKYRHVVFPAALPSFIGGLKQAWAFAWRSLMAGELIVIIATRPSLGARLQIAREFADSEGMLAAMIVILMIGIAVDSLVFGRLERAVRRRWGLLDPAGG